MSDARMAERVAAAAEACRLMVREEPFSRIVEGLGPHGEPAGAFQLLSRITAKSASGEEVGRLSASIPSAPDANQVERTLLVLASQHAIGQVADLAVSDSVKSLFVDDFLFFASPPAEWVPRFRFDDVRFREMARIASLRRFPAGTFDWEISGLSRSWILKASQPWRVAAHVLGQMGGFAPLFELHLNDRRKKRKLLLEKEANLSYYRAARSMEKQPEMKGLMTSSWLFCEATAQMTPRLAWLRQNPQSGGALIMELGPADEDSGFLTGSDERRQLYEQGVYRPRDACILWPRKALIRWANEHPEFEA
jgi:hypothetical protein